MPKPYTLMFLRQEIKRVTSFRISNFYIATAGMTKTIKISTERIKFSQQQNKQTLNYKESYIIDRFLLCFKNLDHQPTTCNFHPLFYSRQGRQNNPSMMKPKQLVAQDKTDETLTVIGGAKKTNDLYSMIRYELLGISEKHSYAHRHSKHCTKPRTAISKTKPFRANQLI